MPKYKRESVDLFIVGAGSSGMAVALEACRHGLRPVLIDGSPKAQMESRGTGVSARTLELLDLHGVSDAIVSQANIISYFITYLNGEEESRVDFSQIDSRFSRSPALPQYLTEGVLRKRLADYGVEPLWDHRLLNLEQSGDTVLVTVENSREVVQFEAKYVVGCDGARSTTRKLIDLQFEGAPFAEGWGLMDLRLEWDENHDAVRIYRIEGDPQQFVLTALGKDYYRIQIDCRSGATALQPPELDELRAAFKRFTGKEAKLSDPIWNSAFNVNLRQVVSYRSGRVFLAGDAAHIHTPAGAQGLNTGIQDGLNLGWKIAMVVQGQAKPDLLDTYEEERKPIAAGVLALSAGLASEPARMIGQDRASQKHIANRMGQLLVNYREGPLSQEARAASGLAAGDRIPDVELVGKSIYKQLGHPGFTLALFGEMDVEKLIEASPVPLKIIEFGSNSEMAAAIGGNPGAALLRPDGYLGYVGDGLPASAAARAIAWLNAKVAA